MTSSTPSNGATGVSAAQAITINFSESVDIATGAFTVECPVGTPIGFISNPVLPVTTGTSSVVLTPTSAWPASATCTVTAIATEIRDRGGNAYQLDGDKNGTGGDNYVFTFTTASSNPCNDTFTPIYSIQGSGLSAAITGAVTTQGVVVGDYELPTGTGQIRGFYLQDPTGDSNAATSDGIFVYNSGVDTVSVGQVVRVQGTAGEFAGQTQISGPTVIQCGTTGSVTPVDVTLPVASTDYLERFEGMLVRFPQTLYVTEHYQLGRFGQVVLSSSSRLAQPTNVALPGAPALAVQTANDLNRIIVDDEINNQNPDPIKFGRGGNPLSASNTLRGGDTVTNLTGVLVYDWAGDSASPAAYRVRPIAALNGGVPTFVAANARPATPSVGGRLRVTSANLLNYFNTFSGCTSGVGGAATDCRGAENTTEFDRQWPKTVANLVNGGADVIGVMEMENDGYGAGSAIQHLVDKLNDAAGAGTYAFIDADTLTGQVNALGVDAIKVGLIYKPAKVTPVGTTAALNTTAFVNGGDAVARNRPALAQAFQEVGAGERFVVVVNHLKSKGSACDAPDAGAGQGNCSVVRTSAANTLTAWLAGDPTGIADPDVLIMGDLNSYAKEDPITAIKNAGYVNLIEDRLGATAYSYAFNGQWGYLDHALASTTLAAQVVGVEEWHINADEPTVLDYNTNFKSAGQLVSLYSSDQFRSSDHDPVIIGIDLTTSYDLSDLGGYPVAWHASTGLKLGATWANGHATVGSGTNDGLVSFVGLDPDWRDGGHITVNVRGNLVAGACVYGWIDWNQNENFGDTDESSTPANIASTTNTDVNLNVYWTDDAGVFDGLAPDRTYNLRLRLVSGVCGSHLLAASLRPNADLMPAGGASSGEVEDHALSFTPNALTLTSLSARAERGAGAVLPVLGLIAVGVVFALRRARNG